MNDPASREPPEPGTQPESEVEPVLLSLAVEGGLGLLAVGLGAMGLCDPLQSLSAFGWQDTLRPAIIHGTLGCLPLVALALWVGRSGLDWNVTIRQSIRKNLLPMLGGCSISALAVISIAAGIGEELLFRWSLQGGLTSLLQPLGGWWLALIVVSLAFGFCHALNWPYVVMATLTGAYLGLLMVWSGTWLAAAFSHALLDFFALCLYCDYLPLVKIRKD